MASAEIFSAAQQLDLNLDASPELTPVVEDMVKPESLPVGWTAQFDPGWAGQPQWNYTNAAGEVSQSHPLIEYYRGTLYMQQGGYRTLLEQELKHPPDAGEIDDMCAYLGVDGNEDPYLREVAHLAISAPLPDGWVEEQDETGNAAFRNTQMGISQPHHPLDAYFLELLRRRRDDLATCSDGVKIKGALASTRMQRLAVMQASMPRGGGEAAEAEAAENMVAAILEEATPDETAEIVFEVSKPSASAEVPNTDTTPVEQPNDDVANSPEQQQQEDSSAARQEDEQPLDQEPPPDAANSQEPPPPPAAEGEQPLEDLPLDEAPLEEPSAGAEDVGPADDDQQQQPMEEPPAVEDAPLGVGDEQPLDGQEATDAAPPPDDAQVLAEGEHQQIDGAEEGQPAFAPDGAEEAPADAYDDQPLDEGEGELFGPDETTPLDPSAPDGGLPEDQGAVGGNGVQAAEDEQLGDLPADSGEADVEEVFEDIAVADEGAPGDDTAVADVAAYPDEGLEGEHAPAEAAEGMPLDEHVLDESQAVHEGQGDDGLQEPLDGAMDGQNEQAGVDAPPPAPPPLEDGQQPPVEQPQEAGPAVVLASCLAKFVVTDPAGQFPTSTGQHAGAPDSVWSLEDHGENMYSLSCNGLWLSALAPAPGAPTVCLVPQRDLAEMWEICALPPSADAPASEAPSGGVVGVDGGELPRWGYSQSYSVRNCATGMYLAALPDGVLMAEDESLGQPDLAWSIYSAQPVGCAAGPAAGGFGGSAVGQAAAAPLSRDVNDYDDIAEDIDEDAHDADGFEEQYAPAVAGQSSSQQLKGQQKQQQQAYDRTLQDEERDEMGEAPQYVPPPSRGRPLSARSRQNAQREAARGPVQRTFLRSMSPSRIPSHAPPGHMPSISRRAASPSRIPSPSRMRPGGGFGSTTAERGREMGVNLRRRPWSCTQIELGLAQARSAAASQARAADAANASNNNMFSMMPGGGDGFPMMMMPHFASDNAMAAAAASAMAALEGNAAFQIVKDPGRERISVALRARPLVQGGTDQLAWVIDSMERTITVREGVHYKGMNSHVTPQVFNFDIVLGPDHTTQQLFEGHLRPLVDSALQGINCTVFAYGQTGSGKTYTMFGSQLSDGAVGMALTHLFLGVEHMGQANPHDSHEVKLSMMELYNEQLRDLMLSPAERAAIKNKRNHMSIVDDPRVGTRVMGLMEIPVPNLEAAYALVEHGAASRAVGATAMNAVSTRSHTIVKFLIETRNAATGDLKKTAIVNFVDLAGSERLAKTGSVGMRFVEGANINLSLLNLGTVVSRLAEGRRGEYVPFRNSKLTRLLQPCLGGNARTAVVAVINPSHLQVEESFNTMKFAQRAMTVTNQVHVNQTKKGQEMGLPKEVLMAYQQQITSLRQQLSLMQAGRGDESSVRIAQLEADKIRLMDVLEGLTGQPQGDVTDNPTPPRPPDLDYPSPQPRRQQEQADTADKALRSIARIAGAGREGGPDEAVGGGGAPAAAALARSRNDVSPEDVVMAVRDMRAERDELRRRDAQARGGNMDYEDNEARPIGQGQAPHQPPAAPSADEAAIAEGVHALEDALGAAHPDTAWGLNVADRIRESVAVAAVQAGEIRTLEQQLATSEALRAAADHRLAVAELHLNAPRQQPSDSQDYMADDDGAGPTSQQQIQSLEEQLKASRDEVAAVMAELATWRGLAPQPHELASGDAPEVMAVGSFAMRAALEARAMAAALQAQLQEMGRERDELREQLQHGGGAVAGAAGARLSPEEQMNQVEQLQREVLELKRQRELQQSVSMSHQRKAWGGSEDGGGYNDPTRLQVMSAGADGGTPPDPLSIQSILGPPRTSSARSSKSVLPHDAAAAALVARRNSEAGVFDRVTTPDGFSPRIVVMDEPSVFNPRSKLGPPGGLRHKSNGRAPLTSPERDNKSPSRRQRSSPGRHKSLNGSEFSPARQKSNGRQMSPDKMRRLPPVDNKSRNSRW